MQLLFSLRLYLGFTMNEQRGENAMQDRKIIFFDVDGVLLDSLPPHLAICRDKAAQFGLPIEIPDELSFKKIVARGKKINPMLQFFLAVGFPEAEAEIATVDYEKEFVEKYKPEVFASTHMVIDRLSDCGWTLGIVTSNVIENIQEPLRGSMDKFDVRCVFTHDNAPGRQKSWCLVEGARMLEVDPQDCFYVGDLPADATAAENAGYKFIAALYGWGFESSDCRYVSVNSIGELPEMLGC